MNLTEVISTSPIQAEKSARSDEWRCLTSGKAGKIIPLAYAPLLREDRVNRGQARIHVEMMETAETLMNAIHVTAYVHFVPFLAFDRFEGSMDRLNRSYAGVPDTEGGSVVPFFETIDYDSEDEIWHTMGIHGKDGAPMNAAVVQAYNEIVNFRRRARSTKLPQRLKNDTSLAQAFWRNPGLSYIVPDFDQAMIDGEVPLNIADGSFPVRGIGIEGSRLSSGSGNYAPGVYEARETGGISKTGRYTQEGADKANPMIALDGDDFPAVYAELEASGITVSLSNIELAKRTAAFAALRKKYAGLEDDHLIDMLMEGIRVPDAALTQPILLDRRNTILGYNKRYATDAENLDQSVTTGESWIDVRFRLPPVNTGGVIMVTLEVVPDQLFERKKDVFLHTSTVERLPNFTRDFLDPEKVDVVPNDFVDVEHSTPDGVFGYAPLNHAWKRSQVNIGGKYFRELGDPFNENRQKFWAVERLDPSLTEDFYLVNDLSHSVFADTLADPFEITTTGAVDIIGNTVFGRVLEEDTGDYEAVMDQVDMSRIDQSEDTVE